MSALKRYRVKYIEPVVDGGGPGGPVLGGPVVTGPAIGEKDMLPQCL